MGLRAGGPSRTGVLCTLALLLAACTPDEDSDDATPHDTGQPLALTSRAFSAALIGTTMDWSEVVEPIGGVTPYSYEVIAGSLPPGIAMAGAPLEVEFTGAAAVAGSYPFTLRVTDHVDSTASAAFTILVLEPANLDLGGQWQVTLTVTSAWDVCAGEVGQVSTHELTLEQSGSPPGWQVALSGFHGDPANRVEGGLDMLWGEIQLSGNYPEDGGTTTTEHRLFIYNEQLLRGTESWSWTNGVQDCPNGGATIEAVRVGP